MLQDGIIDLTKADMTNLQSKIIEEINEARQIGSAIERHLSLDQFTKLMMSVRVIRKGLIQLAIY